MTLELFGQLRKGRGKTLRNIGAVKGRGGEKSQRGHEKVCGGNSWKGGETGHLPGTFKAKGLKG